MAQAFITGITGFIGRPLAAALLAHGFSVNGSARRPSQVPGCSVVAGNILQPDSYAAFARSADIVIHLAAPTAAAYIALHPQETMLVNVVGVLNLLDCFEQGAGRHFLLVSSGKVYGGSQLPFCEDQPLNPAGALGRSKKIAEQMVQFFAENSKKQFSIMRLFNGYGPGQSGDFLVPAILQQAPRGSIILGDTAGKRDFIYIDDVVAGIMKVLTAPCAQSNFNVYNLGSGSSYSPAELVALLGEIAGMELVIKSDPSRLRQGADEERADIRRLMALGWTPSTSMKDGLTKSWRARVDADKLPA